MGSSPITSQSQLARCVTQTANCSLREENPSKIGTILRMDSGKLHSSPVEIKIDGMISRNKEIHRQAREMRKRRRNKILELLGGKCKQCGYSDVRALHIDHINGGGGRERRALHQNAFYLSIISQAENDIESFLSKYQLLCANCNAIKLASKEQNKIINN